MRSLGLAVAVVLLSGLLVSAPSAQAAKPGDFRITAHRGAPTSGVSENTVRGMRRAVRLGASALETDVRMTRDGRPVLMHDPTLDRTTTCRGALAARTMRSLRRHCRARDGGEMVPTFGALLRLARKRDVNVLFELKGRGWSRANVDTVARTIADARMVGRVTAMSFHDTPLRRLEAGHPEIATALLVRRWAQVGTALTYADGLVVPLSYLTRDRVAQVEGQGKRVIAKKANNQRRWRALKRLGVGDVITDRISGYRRWLRR